MKRRYRSADSDDAMRELEYFNHPYVAGSSIRLEDDIDLDTSLSLTSLASQFVGVDGESSGKRGKKNVMEREEKKKKHKDEEEEDDDVLGIPGSFEPFEMGKMNY